MYLVKNECVGLDFDDAIKVQIRKSSYFSKSLFLNLNYLVSITAGGPVSPRGHM